MESFRLVPRAEDYNNEPDRNRDAMRVNFEKPFNAEPKHENLVKNFITATDIFYVRTHGPTPDIDANTYEFVVEGLVKTPLRLSLSDVKQKFRAVKLTATLHCAGNRRREMSKAKPVNGVGWDSGAISNAVWLGAPLRDVLLAAQVLEPSEGALHVDFEGGELVKEGTGYYGSSIPIEKAMSTNDDVLLAYEMNDAPLTRDHGFPLRVVVAGYLGARSVKWLRKIVVQCEESKNYFQRRDYKILPPNVDVQDVHAVWESAPSLGELSVNSAILEPVEGDTFNWDHPVTVRGWALSGGGRAIVRVDVSPDGGKTWVQAELYQEKKGPGYWSNQHFAWTLWRCTLPKVFPPYQIVSKAVDSAGNSQPESVESIWNLRGVNNNSWSRVNLRVQNNL